MFHHFLLFYNFRPLSRISSGSQYARDTSVWKAGYFCFRRAADVVASRETSTQANLTLTPSHPLNFPRRQYPFVVVEFSAFLIKRAHLLTMSTNNPPTFFRLDLQ